MNAKSIFSSAFGILQKTGKALMLPVAVLPIAGLLLGVGAAGFSWIPTDISLIMRQSGDAVFANMALIFAVAVALGFTNNDGVAAVAATVGYAVMLATMGVMAKVFGVTPVTVMGMESMQTGVFGGVLAGGVAAVMFNQFYRIKLPPYLGFFAGKRFVPIITAIAAIVLGVVLSVIWPPIQAGINTLSQHAAEGNPTVAASLYGVVERLLVPFGLHHIWNVPFFYEIGNYLDPATGKTVHGDIQRFFAGDPTAGILSGAFLFKMFGLPGAAIAIWHTAKPERRVAVGGIMVSAALTSFLTGITEPIEFSFLFVAPALYGIHALMVGGTQIVMNLLGAHMGFTFSQGGIDFILFNALNPHSQRWWLVLILGPITGVIYYFVFRWAIVFFNMKTPGREDEDAQGGAAVAVAEGSLAGSLVVAFGGRANLKAIDACITRLRITVNDVSQVNKDALKKLGAAGVVEVGQNVQAVFGPLSENYKTDMEIYLKQNSDDTAAEASLKALMSGGAAPQAASAGAAGKPSLERPKLDGAGEAVLKGLGGKDNLKAMEPFGLTRLRIELKAIDKLDEAGLLSAGVSAVMRPRDGVVHLIVGDHAVEGLLCELQSLAPGVA